MTQSATATDPEWLRATLASLDEALIATDTSGTVNFINDRARTLIGCSEDEVRGASLSKVLKILHRDGLGPLECPFLNAITHGRQNHLADSALLVTQVGDPIPIGGTCAPIRDADGQIRGAVLVFKALEKSDRDRPIQPAAWQHVAADFEHSTDGVLLLDRDWRIIAMNREYERQSDLPRTKQVGQLFWEVWPHYVGTALESAYRRAMTERTPTLLETRDIPDGHCYENKAIPTPDGGLAVFVRDLAETQQTNELQRDQKHVLELLARDAPLSEVLEALVQAIERQSRSGLLASILLLGADGKHLYYGAGASLPEAYNKAINGVAIGPAVGSCGTAAYLKQPVYVSDIARDPRWAAFKELAETHQLRACWSTPVFSSTGEVLATFAMYYREARDPPDHDLRLVDIITSTASIAIERKRIEAALRASEQHFRLLFEQAVDGIFVTDAQGHYLDANHAACQMVGYTREELLNLTIIDLVAEEDIPRIAGEVARFVGGAIAMSKWRLRRKDGSFLMGELVGRQLPDGRLQTIVRDITERTQVEAALRESEARFRDLADNIPQLAWIADAGSEGHVHWFNQNWYEYTGTTLEQMRGAGWHAVHHPDHAERVIQKFTHHVQAGLDWEDTFPLRGKDGQYRWFLSRMKVIRDDAGDVVRIFGTNTDITEQRQMEDELRRLAAELATTDRRKNEFLAMLAHELRNPLAPIRNAVTLLRLPEQDARNVQTASMMIERQVDQLVRLVDDLLDVSRISRGKIELRREHVDLDHAVRQVLDTIKPLCEAMGHELIINLPPAPTILYADPIRLAQILGNLLNNACKFTARGGCIGLTVQHDGDDAVILVRDNGIGIEAAQLDRIFDIFMQVDNSLERSVTGLGIGLTLVKSLVEMHEGTIEAHSPGPGLGSEFVLRLPYMRDHPTPRQSPAPIESGPLLSHRILIVDDNQDAALSLATLLTLKGNETQTAFDGVEALERLADFQPDVVLLDIGLPKLNGYEVARKIRQGPGNDKILLVALTGWGQQQDRERSREAGFDEHMVKPVDYPRLANVLASLPE